MTKPQLRTAILGGGPAGLGAGYHLARRQADFALFEAAHQVGGNCATVSHGDFRYDLGAHRFHDKDPEVTKLIRELMGDELLHVTAPSAIYHNGRFVDFPLSPLNLLRSVGPAGVARATGDWLRAFGAAPGVDFEALTVRRYGRHIAELFLLNYSEKLWGLPASQLSPSISSGRLKGLNLKTFLIESLLGSRLKTRHLDGAFLYPKSGYGAIAERLADACGRNRIRLNCRVTRLMHDGKRITTIEINGTEQYDVEHVISSLPMPLLLRMLTPAVPDAIITRANTLKFRDVLLVGLLLDRRSVSPFATMYFPAHEIVCTRVYEPRNRSPFMSPEGRTSLVAEIALPDGAARDEVITTPLIGKTVEDLIDTGLIQRSQIAGTFVNRLPRAYPVLEIGIENTVEEIANYLTRFENLVSTGRNGRFQYTSLHDMLRWGREAAEGITTKPQPTMRDSEPLAAVQQS